MSEVYQSDADPDAIITQMYEERGYASTAISQRIQQGSQILRMAEATKKPMPEGVGDYYRSVIFDIAQPSARDVVDHQKRLASARPGNSPDDVPVRTIPYGSRTVEGCLYGWAWDTQWFSKIDLGFKARREEQLAQVRQIFTDWSGAIWEKWVWRAYQRCVENYVLNPNIPHQHGASGYPLADPTSVATIPWLDKITHNHIRRASGLVGSPVTGKWCVFIGEEEFKVLFDEYVKGGAASDGFGVRKNSRMEDYERYDADLLGGMPHYKIGQYCFFVEPYAPRYRARVGSESWDDALLDDIEQNPATRGTQSEVPDGYSNPEIAKFSEILIWNAEAMEWLTPPSAFSANNNFHVDSVPGYSYAGEFVPVTKTNEQDPFHKKVKYYAEYIAGYRSVFPKKGAAILCKACHVNPEIVSYEYNLEPVTVTEEVTPIIENVPILPAGTLQLQTKLTLPNVSDGYSLFMRTAGGKVAKLSTVTSAYCEATGYYLHSVTFDTNGVQNCAPRDCDQWKEVVSLPEDTTESTLWDETGCAICSGYASSTAIAPVTVTYSGDNIRGVTIGSTNIEGTEAAVSTLEAAVQTHLDGLTDGGTVSITESDDLWTITLTDSSVTSFSVYAEADGGGLVVHSSDGTSSAARATAFTVVDNGTEAAFATYPGEYYDTGENTTSGDYPVYTNGTTFAAAADGDWDGAVMKYYASLANAKAQSTDVFYSAASGVGNVLQTSDDAVSGTQTDAL